MFLSVLDVDAPLWLSYLLPLQVIDTVVGYWGVMYILYATNRR